MTDEEARKKILQDFYRAPFRYSHNFGNIELQLERDAETIKYGHKLFPDKTEEEIFEIAREPQSEDPAVDTSTGPLAT